MKFKVFLVLVFVLFASQVCASPFLVSDPQLMNEQTGASGYKISWDNGVTWTECGFVSVGEDQIKVAHDLSGTPVGDHSILVKAYNLWEESDSVPFDFGRQSPALPTNMRLTDSVGE